MMSIVIATKYSTGVSLSENMATKRKNQSVITNFFAGKTNTNEGQAQNPSSTPIPGSADLNLEEQPPQKKSKGKQHLYILVK